MSYITFAFETEVERSTSTARKCTDKYAGERSRGDKNVLVHVFIEQRGKRRSRQGTELISRLRAKSLYGKGRLGRNFQKGGA